MGNLFYETLGMKSDSTVNNFWWQGDQLMALSSLWSHINGRSLSMELSRRKWLFHPRTGKGGQCKDHTLPYHNNLPMAPCPAMDATTSQFSFLYHGRHILCGYPLKSEQTLATKLGQGATAENLIAAGNLYSLFSSLLSCNIIWFA